MNGIYKKCVYIGNPNQTRHLGDHHRRIETLEQERHILLNLFEGVNIVAKSLSILRSRGVNMHYLDLGAETRSLN